MRSFPLSPVFSATGLSRTIRGVAFTSALAASATVAGSATPDSGTGTDRPVAHSVRFLDPVSGNRIDPSATGIAVPLRSPLDLSAGERTDPGIPGTATFSLTQVSELPLALFESLAFGDTDHDAQGEAVLYNGGSGDFHFRVLEEQGNDVYTEEYAGPSLIPYAVSDLDGDGLSEVIGQDGNWVYVYESESVSSYPNLIAWRSPVLENIVGFTAVGDTDRDGKMEIIHSRNPWEGESSLLIYETNGDDAFSLVLDLPTGEGDKGRKAIGDFDQDGLVEIVFGGLNGDLHVIESSADDVWTETFTLETGLFNSFWCIGGQDTDGNGKPEFFLQGSRIEGWSTYIFEATGNDTYGIVNTLIEDDGYVGLSSCTLAQLEPGGPTYYVSDIAERLSIYQPVGPGDWQKILEQPDPDGTWHHGVFAYDANGNGRDELFWCTGGDFATLVLEAPSDPSAVDETGRLDEPFVTGGHDRDGMFARFAPLHVAPNPVRDVATLWHSSPSQVSTAWQDGETDGLRIEVLNGTGRRVRTEPFDPSAPRWNTDALPAGRYVLRLYSEAGTIAAGPVTVIR